MTQEEKAKCYDIALDKIKMLLGTGSSCSREELEYVFPELKESEDERIRKVIINLLKQSTYENCIYEGIKIEDIYTWLEKQGEQNLANSAKTCKDEQKPWSKEDEAGLGDALWCCKQAASIAKDENDMGNVWYAEHWLKSLKDRYAWNPSDEQIKALKEAVDEHFDIDGGALWHLYQELKNLKK